jgi:AcrR family transcriptional regulator
MSPLSRPDQGNPRVRRTRGRILAVARDLLPEVGAAGLTYSRLADQTGVTRQTLYRHWPTRAALLVDLILEGPEVGYPEPGPDPRVVAVAWLVSLRAGLSDRAARAAVLAVTAEAEHDPDSAEALRQIEADRLAALNKLLEPAGRQVTGEEYTLLYGPVMARLFFERSDVTDGFIDTVVTQWLAAAGGLSAGPANSPGPIGE